MFSSKGSSFDILKERVQNAQQGFSDGWKNIAVKAKKEVKIVNKIARKALATEDGGKLRDGYVVTVDLDAGYDLFKGFQENWMSIHKDSVTNVQRAGHVDRQLNGFIKDWQKCESYLEEFQGNLIMLPEVISKVDIIQKRIDAIGKQSRRIEELLLEYEDACERYELEKCKVDMRVKLSSLVEAKHAEYTLRKALANKTEEANSSIVTEMSIKKIAGFPQAIDESTESADKQKAYEDAFLQQMNQYIKYGEIEKPIAGSLTEQNVVSVEDINIEDSDLSTLSEFLGPEEMNSLLEVQASQSKLTKANENSAENESVTKPTTETPTTGDSPEKNTGEKPADPVIETVEPSAVGATDAIAALVVEAVAEEGSNVSTGVPENNDNTLDSQISHSDDETEFFDAPS